MIRPQSILHLASLFDYSIPCHLPNSGCAETKLISLQASSMTVKLTPKRFVAFCILKIGFFLEEEAIMSFEIDRDQIRAAATAGVVGHPG
jgi:hypothetical protein